MGNGSKLVAAVLTLAFVLSLPASAQRREPLQRALAAPNPAVEPARGESRSLIVDDRRTGATFELRAALPASTGRTALAIEGTVALLQVDDFDARHSELVFEVHGASGAPTRLAHPGLAGVLRRGMHVAVSGWLAADGIGMVPERITILGSSEDVTKARVAKAFATNNVLVVLMTFTDSGPLPFTRSEVQDVFTGAAGSVAGFYSEASYGQQLMSATVTDWLATNAATPASCDWQAMGTLGRSAAISAGYSVTSYQNIVYVFPKVEACAWAGTAYVGGYTVWVNGRNNTHVFAHELGHNLGLAHAGSLRCGAGAIGGACTVSEYGDPFDVMGDALSVMHFSASQKLALGWIAPSTTITHPGGTSTYLLGPLELGGSSTYAVRIPAAPDRTYWIEYRQPIGFDAGLAALPHNGVQIRVASPFETICPTCTVLSNDTELLDMTPDTPTFDDATLLVGNTFADPAYSVNVTVLAANSAGAFVVVSTPDAAPPPPATTTTVVTSSANPAFAGAPVTFTATVSGAAPTGLVVFTDNGSMLSGCAAVSLTGGANARTATCTTASLAVGTHVVIAAYAGDSANTGSSSSAYSQVINAVPLAATATVLASSPNPAVAGATVVFSATVTGIAPTGTVAFTEAGASLAGCGAATVVGTGNVRAAACTTASLGVGTHAIVATYSGDSGNARSTSSAVSQVITPVVEVPLLANGGFETPAVGTSFVYVPANAAWTFASDAGITGNASAFTSGNPNAPEGSQVAFLQNDGSATQAINLAAGSYTITLQAAQRGNYQRGAQTVTVRIDGAVVGQYQPPGAAYTSYATTFAVVASGAHTLTLAGSGSGIDSTVLIDNVRVAVAGSAKPPTTTTLASSVNPATAGNAIALTATVAGAGPTGGVAFTDNGSAMSGCTSVTLAGSGNARTATCTTTGLGVGTHAIVATYTGDSANAASSSSAYSQVVAAKPVVNATSTVLASSSNPASVGTSVAFTATVTGIGPTGSVSFTDGGAAMAGCTAVALAGVGNMRAATCTATSLGAGTHGIVASYSGDTANAPSTSSALAQVLTVPGDAGLLGNPGFETPGGLGGSYAYLPANATWTFASQAGISGNASAFTSGNPNAPEGSQVAFLQNDGSAAQAINLAAGRYTLSLQAAQRGNYQFGAQTVRVLVDGVAIGQFQPTGTSYSAWQATFTLTTSGSHTVTLAGSGSASDSTVFVDSVRLAIAGVTAAPTTTTIASSANPASAGTTVALTATVTGAAPTGSVAFSDSGNAIAGCTSVALAGSGNARTATCAAASLTAGTHAIVATYAGDLANAPSTSSAYSQVIDAAPHLATTTTTLASSSNPAPAGTSVILTATVTGVAPMGGVGFSDNGAVIAGCAAVALVGTGNARSASCTTSTLGAGTHAIVAAYPGDAANASSTSSALAQTITGAVVDSGLVANAGFEAPALAGRYAYLPDGAAWVFAGQAGITGNGNAFTSGNANAPQGAQVAFLQNDGTASQAINVPGGRYVLTFNAAQRGNYQLGTQTVRVLIDGVAVGQYQPPGTSYTSYQTLSFAIATTGIHTLTLAGAGAGIDCTAFVDNVILARSP